jgi:hypothetical protein
MSTGALLSKQFLSDIGVAIDDHAYEALSEHYAGTLHERVITEITNELDEDALSELSTLREGSPEQLQQWLQINVPQLDEIVQDETAILLGELAENAESIA